MHLSGMSIYVGGNRIEAVQQTHLFFGGTLSGGFFDCVENISVEDNSLVDSVYVRGFDGGARLPKINTDLVLVRHYVDPAASPEKVLVEPSDFAGLEPGAVTFADAPDERRCDDRMADA